jgi:hypothetical protein
MTNLRIEDYNRVVDELIFDNEIFVIPPDFYTYFRSNPDKLGSDGIHPNGVGYQSMGNLWSNALQMIGFGGTVDFTTETFANLSSWTEIGTTGRHSIVSNQLKITWASGAFTGLIYNTQTSSLTQHAKMQFVNGNNAWNAYPGFWFRRTGTANAKLYGLDARDGYSDVGWAWHTENSTLSIGGVIQTGNFGSALADGEWIGVEVTGTGADTIVYVWKWASDPGVRANWGTASLTFTNDPGGNACDTGLYIGIRGYAGAATDVTLDNWTGGPQ